MLSYLSELETRLALLHLKSSNVKPISCTSPTRSEGSNSSEGEIEAEIDVDDMDLSVEDVTAFVNDAFEMLETIRTDVCSYLPGDFDFGASGPSALRNRLPEFDVRSKIKEFGELEFPAMPSIDDIRGRIYDISPANPLSYVPTLHDHLSNLQAHLQSVPFSVPSSSTLPLPTISPPKVLSDLLADLLEEDTEEAIQEDIKKAKAEEETMHEQVKRAVVKSGFGQKLIRFEDLPGKWKNNKYVFTGYR